MAFRYRVLLYHENQDWVYNVASVLDVPLFHLMQTDSETIVYSQLEAGEVDVILSGIHTQYFQLIDDTKNSLSFKKGCIWEIAESRNAKLPIILLCTSQDVDIASGLVQDGRVADYLIVEPISDRNRIFITIMKTLETALLRDIVETKLLKAESLPKNALESIETLETLKNAPEEPEIQDSAFMDFDGISAEGTQDESFISQEPAFSFESAAAESSSGLFTFESASNEAAGGDSFFSFEMAAAGGATDEAGEIPASFFDSLKQNLMGDVDFDLEPVELKKTRRKPGQGHDAEGKASAWTKLKSGEFEVLLMDPDPDNIENISKALSDIGLRVCTATNAADGLTCLNREIFKLLLLNLDLPDKFGFDFLSKLRYKGPQSRIPAIVLSDYAIEEHITKCARLSADYFITRPFDKDRFIKRVGLLLPA